MPRASHIALMHGFTFLQAVSLCLLVLSRNALLWE